MRWTKPSLRDDVLDPAGRDQPSSTGWVRNQGLEEVRKAMLQALSGLAGCEVARMNLRLRYAADIEALWYLRADLFNTLAPLQGESGARGAVDQLTLLFSGRLPTMPRPATAPGPIH
jgi:hypothetical protein